jgi:heme exporter protein B
MQPDWRWRMSAWSTKAHPAVTVPVRGQAFRHWLRALSAILWKDLVSELRSKELLSSLVVFALLVVLVFNFALELDRGARENVAAGVLWVTAIFTATLGLNRSLAAEKERGSLDGLLLAPVDRSALYLGKTAGNIIFMLLVQAVVLPVFSVLFNLGMFRPLLLAAVLLGTVGYAAVGTLLASMAAHSRSRDLMLPILLFPVAIPVLVAVVKASSGALTGLPWEETAAWFHLLIGYDVIFLATAFLLFDYVVEE